MLKRYLTAVLLMISCSVMAQDPEFTQFYANQLYLNPAFAGSARCPRLCLNYRNQWPALTGTFITYSASYDQQIEAMADAFAEATAVLRFKPGTPRIVYQAIVCA